MELKRRAIEKKGLPPWKQCLFITLTLDQVVGNRVDSYELGNERMRRFLGELRKVIGKFPWAWKLEFQDNGYAHWHVIVHYKKTIPRDCLCLLGKWWGLGRTNVERLRYKKFRYLFKYVSKGAFDGESEEGLNLPEWVMDYQNGSRMRFWQTGGGFYTKAQDPDWSVEEEEKKDQRFSYVKETIRQKWRYWMRRAVVSIRDPRKDYPVKSSYFVLNKPYNEFYQEAVNLTVRGKAALSGLWAYMTPAKIQENIEQWQTITLKRMTECSGSHAEFFGSVADVEPLPKVVFEALHNVFATLLHDGRGNHDFLSIEVDHVPFHLVGCFGSNAGEGLQGE
ncbi:MAG: hypothetical protein AAFX93_20530 [Verrucomicrobiota bacterium]